MSQPIRQLRPKAGAPKGLQGTDWAVPPGGAEAARSEPADGPSDAELIRRCLDGLALEDGGDPFAALMERHQRRAFWVAFHVVGGVEDARDVVQDAFVRLHGSLDKFDFGRNFFTWFHRIVVNLAIDHLRRMKARPAGSLEPFGDRLASDLDSSAGAERGEARDRVWSTLQRLDPKYRAVLVLRDIHDLSCREIAVVLGVTHATARWRLHRSRQMFATAWHAAAEVSAGDPGSAERRGVARLGRAPEPRHPHAREVQP